MKVLLCALVISGTLVGTAQARVYSVQPKQDFVLPNPDYTFYPGNVAIDGDSIIALVDRTGGRSALLYRRGSDGTWALSRTLLDVSGSSTTLRNDLEMANGIAAIRLNDVLHIFERNGNDWTESATAGTPRPVRAGHVSGGGYVSDFQRRTALSALRDQP
jgi:hypothetical protein